VIALLGAELQRITSRRMTRVFFIVLVSGFFILIFQAILRTPASEPFMLAKDGADLPNIVGLMIGFLSIVLGASAFGADTGCGALATQLTWEPRRARVLGARATSVALAAAALSAVTTVAALAAATIATSIGPHAYSAGVDSAWWSDRVAEAGVATGAAACCAVAGMALAVLMWNSTGPIVLVGAMSIVGEPLLANWNALPQWLRDRLPLSSLLGLASAGELVGQRLPVLGVAAVAWALGLLAIGAWWFGRREIR
jgi:hypothetical protein